MKRLRRPLAARTSALLASAAALIGPSTATAVPPETPPEPPEPERDPGEAESDQLEEETPAPPLAAGREEPSRPSIGRPAQPAQAAGDRDFEVVQPGDTLWSIARRLLGPDQSDAAVAREAARLWQLNGDRIGTGHPDVLLPGTVLRLR
jgi:nucleoid-associated protein YgaU